MYRNCLSNLDACTVHRHRLLAAGDQHAIETCRCAVVLQPVGCVSLVVQAFLFLKASQHFVCHLWTTQEADIRATKSDTQFLPIDHPMVATASQFELADPVQQQ